MFRHIDAPPAGCKISHSYLICAAVRTKTEASNL
jgi:hypothetical protein